MHDLCVALKTAAREPEASDSLAGRERHGAAILMEATIRVLNQMAAAGVIEAYALGGAMAAVFHVVAEAVTSSIEKTL